MKVKDPVCGMEIEKFDAEAEMDYKEKTYFFCSTGCRDEFKKKPEKYLKSQA